MAKKRKVPVNIYISEDIAEKLSRVKHGFKSALIEKLLREFFEKVGEDDKLIMAYVLGLDFSTTEKEKTQSNPIELRNTNHERTKELQRKEKKIPLPDEEEFFG